ncbi:MAG: N-acetyltransferase family protein [Lachnotalea sp.]
MEKNTIRFVQEEDAEEILEIYKPYIKNTVISFEYEIPSLEEFRTRIKKISADYPYIVYLEDDKIIGYAYANRQKERAAYQWNAELSIYIEQSHFRRGLGKILYSALMDISVLQNICNVYGVTTANNQNSEKLHEYLGFNKLGVYHHTGYKFVYY